MSLKSLLCAFVSLSSLMASSPSELQKEADQVREEGKSLEAINLYNHAIVGYQTNKDYSNMLGALTGRLLSWKHLFYQTEDKIYAIMVKKEAEALFEIAKHYDLLDRLYLIHFLNGTAATLLNDHTSAEKEFGLAVKLYPHEKGEKGDWIGHLGDAMYKNGKKDDGMKTLLQGIAMMKERNAQIDPFLFNVWMSGAYLRLAKLLVKDNPAKSQHYFELAKTIIEADARLVIRKQQLEAFKPSKA